MKYATLVVGPAGAGKSTLCSTLQKQGPLSQREIDVINLDPAAEAFIYDPSADVRDLIQLEDVLESEDLDFGPNGGLVFCMEYLMESDGIEWLEECVMESASDFLILDCPGQIELYTHLNIMPRLIKLLQSWNIRLSVMYVMDCHYMVDSTKFLSGSLSALSVMFKLSLPQINVLSKCDLLSRQSRENLADFLEPSAEDIILSDEANSGFDAKYKELTLALAGVLDSTSMIAFVPLNNNKENSVSSLLLQLDLLLQYGEEHDVKTKDYGYEDED